MEKTKVGTLKSSGPYRPISIHELERRLSQAGKSWPVCDCHGEPKIWNPWSIKGGGKWQCRIKKQENSRKQRQIRKANGLCQTCAYPHSKCECRVILRMWLADRDIKKYERLLALDKDDPEFIAIVRKEINIGQVRS